MRKAGNQMRILRLLFLSFAFGLGIIPLTVSAEPAAVQHDTSISLHLEPSSTLQNVCTGNRLVNGDFEGSYNTRGRNEIVVADGWSPWFKASPGTGGINYIPEYKPEDAQVFGNRRVHSGRFAQKWFTTYATHTAGLLQQVSGVPVGNQLQLSAWVQVWSSDADDPSTSETPGNYRVSVGIDPFGGTDYNSENIVWSEPNTFAYDAYKQLSVATVARNNVVTVFLSGVPEFPVKHNDSYWDDACLVAVTPTSAPAPTDTPLPTRADAVVNTALLNLRAGPGTEYDVLGTLERGTPLTVEGRLADNSWLRVTDDSGTAGWVSTDLVRLDVDLNQVPVSEAVPPTPTLAVADTPASTATPKPTETPVPASTVAATQTPQAVVSATKTEPAAGGGSQVDAGSATTSAPPPEKGGQPPTPLNCAPALLALGLGLFGLVLWPRRRTTFIRATLLLVYAVVLHRLSPQTVGERSLAQGYPPPATPTATTPSGAYPPPAEPTGTRPSYPSPAPTDTSLPTRADAVVNTALLNLRAGPGTEYDILGTLERGAPLTVEGRLADNSWLRVTDDSGTAGWVSTDLVGLGVDLNQVPVSEAVPPTPTLAVTDTPASTATPKPTETPVPTSTVAATQTPQAVVSAAKTEPAAGGGSQVDAGSATTSAPPPEKGGQPPTPLNCAPALLALGLGLFGLVLWPRRRRR